jgi:hypothetical protein
MARFLIDNFIFLLLFVCNGKMRFATWQGHASKLLYENFQRLSQLMQVTKVVIGSSAERVCIW